MRLLLALAAGLVSVAATTQPVLTSGGLPGSAAGVAVSEIRYELGVGDTVAAVTFAVSSQDATQVRARVRRASPFVECTPDGVRWRCPLGGVALAQVEALAVAASA